MLQNNPNALPPKASSSPAERSLASTASIQAAYLPSVLPSAKKSLARPSTASGLSHLSAARDSNLSFTTTGTAITSPTKTSALSSTASVNSSTSRSVSSPSSASRPSTALTSPSSSLSSAQPRAVVYFRDNNTRKVSFPACYEKDFVASLPVTQALPKASKSNGPRNANPSKSSIAIAYPQSPELAAAGLSDTNSLSSSMTISAIPTQRYVSPTFTSQLSPSALTNPVATLSVAQMAASATRSQNTTPVLGDYRRVSCIARTFFDNGDSGFVSAQGVANAIMYYRNSRPFGARPKTVFPSKTTESGYQFAAYTSK